MIQIGKRSIGLGQPCFVIAEIGSNFQNVEEAKQLIKAAAEAGADAVKLQTFRAETVVAPDAEFTLEDGSRISQYEFLKATELSEEAHKELKQEIENLGLIFFSTPSTEEDADLLERVGTSAFKTGSDDLTNYPFLSALAARQLPMIISTGMSVMEDVKKAAEAVQENPNVLFLHCAVGYPAAPEIANLRAIETMRKELGRDIGFSDHTLGIIAPVAAMALGAVALEKHLAFDRSRGGPDNDVAMEPEDFKAMVRAVRIVETMLGTGEKRVQEKEEKWREVARKSIVAKKDIPEGTTITEDMLAVRRPADGLAPEYWNRVAGAKAKRTLKSGERISLKDIV